MERNEWADRFTDNVIRRTDRDSSTSAYVVLLLLAFPPILAVAFGAFVVLGNREIFGTDDLTIPIVTALVGECCITSFLLFSMNRTDRRHQSRDMEWMDSLIGYVKSKDGDTSEMERSRAKLRITGWRAKGVFSAAILTVNLLILVALGASMLAGIDILDHNITAFVIASYVLLLIQLVFTMGTTIRFPYRHERAQCEFTEALSREMRAIGIQCEPMVRATHRTFMVVHILLFVVTLGLYSAVLLLLTTHRMNRHIRIQWKYEEELMRRIIEFEGGVGVEGVGCNQPRNRVARALKNSM